MRILLILFCLSGCELVGKLWKPEPYNVLEHGKRSYHSPKYKKAYEDGCESGVRAYGGDIYKAFYKFKYDAKLHDDIVYKRTWRDAYNYCRHYTGRHLRHGIFSVDNPPNSKSLLGTGSLSNSGFNTFAETSNEWDLIPKPWKFYGETDMWGPAGHAFTGTQPSNESMFSKTTDSFFSQGMGTNDFDFLGAGVDKSMF